MQIALCFSGLPRYVRECFELTRINVMQWHDVDVFAHVWETDPKQIEDLKSLYKPKLIETEPGRQFTARGHSQSMWYSHRRCNDLRKRAEAEGSRYEIVVRHRTDLAVLEKVKYNTEPGIYVPIRECNEADDRFAFGTPEFMDIYANVADYATDERMNRIHAEQALYEYLTGKNVPIRYDGLNCFIARAAGYAHYPHADAERVMGEIRSRLMPI